MNTLSERTIGGLGHEKWYDMISGRTIADFGNEKMVQHDITGRTITGFGHAKILQQSTNMVKHNTYTIFKSQS